MPRGNQEEESQKGHTDDGSGEIRSRSFFRSRVCDCFCGACHLHIFVGGRSWPMAGRSKMMPGSERARVQSQDERNSTPEVRTPNCPLGGLLSPRAPYRGALIPGPAGQPHMKLWALCQRQRALSQETLPVFVLILPICLAQRDHQ